MTHPNTNAMYEVTRRHTLRTGALFTSPIDPRELPRWVSVFILCPNCLQSYALDGPRSHGYLRLFPTSLFPAHLLLLYLKKEIYFQYSKCLCVCMCVCLGVFVPCVCKCLCSPEEGVWSPGTEVSVSCEGPCGAGNPTTEPSLQHLTCALCLPRISAWHLLQVDPCVHRIHYQTAMENFRWSPKASDVHAHSGYMREPLSPGQAKTQ